MRPRRAAPSFLFAFALLARPADDLAAPAALRARAAHGEERLLINHLASSAADGTLRQAVFGRVAPEFFAEGFLVLHAAVLRVHQVVLGTVEDFLPAEAVHDDEDDGLGFQGGRGARVNAGCENEHECGGKKQFLAQW